MNIERYAGIFKLTSSKHLQTIPPHFEQAHRHTQLCNLLHQCNAAVMELQAKKGNLGIYLGGQLHFDNGNAFKVYFAAGPPEYPLEGIIYVGQAEIFTSGLVKNNALYFYIYASPHENDPNSEGFYAHEFALIRHIPPKPDHIDDRLIGHCCYSNYMTSGGFSLYSEKNLLLRANGRFIRKSSNHTTGNFADEYGNWAGTSSGKYIPPNEQGKWEVKKDQLLLYFDDKTYLQCRFEVSTSGLFCYYGREREYWKRVG